MKKYLLLLISLLITLVACGQPYYSKGLISGDDIRIIRGGSFILNDSVVDYMYPGIIPNTFWVEDYVTNNAPSPYGVDSSLVKKHFIVGTERSTETDPGDPWELPSDSSGFVVNNVPDGRDLTFQAFTEDLAQSSYFYLNPTMFSYEMYGTSVNSSIDINPNPGSAFGIYRKNSTNDNVAQLSLLTDNTGLGKIDIWAGTTPNNTLFEFSRDGLTLTNYVSTGWTDDNVITKGFADANYGLGKPGGTGAMLVWNGTSWTDLPPGATTGDVLTTNGSGVVPSWETPSGGSSYTFQDGITESAGTVSLGGALPASTTFSGVSSDIFFGTTGSRLSDFYVATNNAFDIDAQGAVNIDAGANGIFITQDGSAALWFTAGYPQFISTRGLKLPSNNNVPTSAADGDIYYHTNDDVFYVRENGVWKPVGTVETPFTGSLTDGAPTAAQLQTAIGVAATGLLPGKTVYVRDSDGSGLMYHVMSDGTSFEYSSMTTAL